MRFISAGAKTGISHLRAANLWSTRTAGRSLPHTAARRRKTALDKPFPLCYLKKTAATLLFSTRIQALCARARPSRSFFIGSNKKESNRREMEGCAFDLLFVRAQTCGAAFSRAAVVWCAFHKAGKCVSFRLLPCVRKGRAAFVRRLPFSGFPALRPGSGHMVEKAAGAFPRPFSIGVEVYVPNHRFPSYLRL